MGTHIDIGIVVRDADACLPFYTDALGLKPIFDLDLPGVRIAMIEDPEGNVVEFLEQKS